MSMADDIVDGLFCEECCTFMGESVGYPRKCSDCKPKKKRKKKKAKRVLHNLHNPETKG